MIACCILFGLPAPELFGSIHEDIEEVVGTAAKNLYDALEGMTDKPSIRKREFLEQVLRRLININRANGV